MNMSFLIPALVVGTAFIIWVFFYDSFRNKLTRITNAHPQINEAFKYEKKVVILVQIIDDEDDKYHEFILDKWPYK